MFLQGEFAAEWDAGSLEDAYGGAALAVKDCEVHFDNIVITGDSIPETLNLAAVSPGSKLVTAWGCIRK